MQERVLKNSDIYILFRSGLVAKTPKKYCPPFSNDLAKL
jgi:hypothetical protein